MNPRHPRAPECQICRGERHIRLPIWRDLSVLDGPDLTPGKASDISHKVYPCPECAPIVDPKQLRRITTGAEVPLVWKGGDWPTIPEGALEHCKEDCARLIGSEMLKNDVIVFEEIDRPPGGIYTPTKVLRATAFVVSKKAAETFTEQFAKHAIGILREMHEGFLQAFDDVATGAYVRKERIDRMLREQIERLAEELKHRD